MAELRAELDRERRARVRLLVVDALQRARGNVAAAARLLGMSREHVSNIIPTLGLCGLLVAVRRESRR